jgi:hypothetical protein
VTKIGETPLDILLKDMAALSQPLRAAISRQLTKQRTWFKMPPRESYLVSHCLSCTPDEAPERQLEVEYASTFLTSSIKIVEAGEMEIDGEIRKVYLAVDPYVEHVNAMEELGQAPKPAVYPERTFEVAGESVQLRCLEPLINGKIKIICILDGGSMIVTMSEACASAAGIVWNPDILIHIESANKSMDRSLGLAQNVPFRINNIVVYLQVHIIKNAAYNVLLGRPFECITRMQVNNELDGSQIVTLTDPNTMERATVATMERASRQLKNESSPAFFTISMN